MTTVTGRATMWREDERAPRQATAWYTRRPRAPGEDLRDLAEWLLEMTGGEGELLSEVVHELALAARFAGVGSALDRMIRHHNRRRAFGVETLHPLGGKPASFRESLGDRVAGGWLGCW